MNTFLLIFLTVCFLPLVPLLYFMLRNETKPHNNIILSTTLPKEAWEDERVLFITKGFKKELNFYTLILLLLYVPVFFIPYISIVMTYIFTWMIFLLILPYLPYRKYGLKLRALKKENWYHPELVKISITDTNSFSVFEEKENNYSFVHFLLPLIVNCIPMLFPLVVPTKESNFLLYFIILMNAFCILLFYVCYRFMYRKKSDRINSDITTTKNLTRIRKYYWCRFWLMMSWLTALFSFGAIFIYSATLFFLILTMIYSLVVLIYTIGVEVKLRNMQQRFNQNEPSEILVDEDDYWPLGLLGTYYYNKNDNNNFVNARVGFNTTVNVAKPFGKWLMIFCAIIILSMPLFGVWLIVDEFSTVEIVLTENSIEAHHTGIEYEIPLEDIISYELLSELPKISRTAGTGLDNVAKGIFSVKGIGTNCRLCLYPKAELFLLIETEEQIYLFGMENTEQMQQIYHTLTQK